MHRERPGQDPHVIHEALHHVLVLRRLPRLHQQTLLAHRLGGQFNLELVLLFTLGVALSYLPSVGHARN